MAMTIPHSFRHACNTVVSQEQREADSRDSQMHITWAAPHSFGPLISTTHHHHYHHSRIHTRRGVAGTRRQQGAPITSTKQSTRRIIACLESGPAPPFPFPLTALFDCSCLPSKTNGKLHPPGTCMLCECVRAPVRLCPHPPTRPVPVPCETGAIVQPLPLPSFQPL